jgi:glutathione synthase/RimK-type ligase-like ATP-grasp enzyme
VPSVQRERPSPSPDAVAANGRGIALRNRRRYDEAIAVFRDAIAHMPDIAELHVNLAHTLDEAGRADDAQAAYRAAVRLAPDMLAAQFGLAVLCQRANDLDEARDAYRRVVEIDAAHLPSHQALYELEQILGDTPAALVHQNAVLARQQMFSSVAPNERRRVLALYAPGAWLANAPVELLFDAQTTTLHKLYLISDAQIDALELPEVDAIFVAMGESESARRALALAERVVRASGLPTINRPDRVLATDRVTMTRTLDTIPNCLVSSTHRVARAALLERALCITLPAIVRPLDSHAGHGLVKIGSAADLNAYLIENAAEEFYVAPFIEYRSPDNYYRKFRLVAVDGEVFPFHLAISNDWMVHFYTSVMRDHQWARDEERAFLADWTTVFGPALREAVARVVEAVGLEYLGIDCAIAPDGRLVVFEVDSAIIIHTLDSRALFPYKHEYVPRIFKALERMVDARRA